jgi:Tol biopolymer transport system component
MNPRLILVALFALGALLTGVAGDTHQRSTVLSCSFPDSFLSFSVFKHDLQLNVTTQVSPEQTGLSFNGQMSDRHGLTYSSDAKGSVCIYTTKTNISVSSGSALNDHARWCPVQKRLLFVSTREPNTVDNEAWTAVFMSTWSDETGLSAPVRLTPPNVADFSPAWGPHTNESGGPEALVAVASGSGRPGGSDIVVMSITENGTVTQRRTVAVNGGWPTFVSVSSHAQPQLLFHRQTGVAMDEWGIFLLDLFTGSETLLIPNGMTPSVSDSVSFSDHTVPVVAFTFVDAATGLRQIGLYNFSSQKISHVALSDTHHYSPFYDQRTNSLYFHKCRGGSFPNIRRRTSGNADLDIAFVSGDFPSMSPDGRSIAAIYANFDYFLSVDVFQSDGTDRKTIYNSTHAWMTSWYNDTIAFTSGPAFASSRDGSVQVSTIHLPTNVVTQLTSSPSFNQGYPSFSPDGSKIVFRTSAVLDGVSPDVPGPYHLRILWSANGSIVGDLTPPASADGNSVIGDTHPHWSTGGIFFASDRGHPGRPTIWRIDADGTGLAELFDRNASSVHPTATPDGRVVFSSTIAGHSMEEIAWPYTFFPNAELFIMSRDGSQLERLTHDASNQANAFAGIQSLPPVLAESGLPTTCRYRDSTNPEPVSAIVSSGAQPAGPSGCLYAKMSKSVLPTDHAVLRKHGVVGADESPISRRVAGGGCPFRDHASLELH